MRALLAILLTLAMTLPAAAEPERLKVVVSFSILGDLVRQIGGDHVAVTQLVGPDGDVHVYQPSPRDARTLAAAQVFVVNGLGLEGWLDRLRQAAGFTGRLIVASDGVTPLIRDGTPDPHAWQDVGAVEHYAKTIAAGLTAADPAHAAEYRAGGDAYRATLADLDAWVLAEIATVPPAKRRIITTHDAFGYFGQAYGVAFEAPVGMAEDSEPSAAAVAGLIRQVRQDGIRALFIENMTDPRLLDALAREAGAPVGGSLFADALSKPGDGGETYVAMIRHNVPLMVTAMGRN